MAARTTARIVRAKLIEPDQTDILGGGAGLVRRALQAGTSEYRNGRAWHVGQIRDEGGYLYGHLGYEQRVGNDQWHGEIKDFAKGSFRRGVAAPFVVRLADLVIVYQPRKGAITPESFVAAFRSILKIGKLGEEWRVQPVPGTGKSFLHWREGVDVVTRIRFGMKPDSVPVTYTSSTAHRLAEAHPESTSIEWHAKRGGLDTDAPLIRELLDQASSGVGQLAAHGRCGDSINAVRRWNSLLGDEDIVTEVEIPQPADEVSRETLLAELQKINYCH
ncbi:MAG TPA: hypothetical protein VFC19_02435 [Candidatus Limnocylindrales bacterium]|nr:hypothetical protein [Candidatus Limnocylindrales bacterium]